MSVTVICVPVTSFDDYSYLSFLIYVKNALGLASENMKTKKKVVRRISTNDIDLKKNRLLPNVDTVEVHLDLFSGHPDGSQNDKKHGTLQNQKECHTLAVTYECGERSAPLLPETFDTHTETFAPVHRLPAEIASMYYLSNF